MNKILNKSKEITISFCILFLLSISSHTKGNQILKFPVIVIKPLGTIEPSIIKNVQSFLTKYFDEVKIGKTENLPAEAFYPPRKRYRADRIIRILHNRSKNGEIYLGITHSDISSTKGSNPDYGLLGLAVSPGKGAIISDFRLKNKSTINKLAIHEIGHSLGLPHCPNNGCYMQDAKGKDHTRNLIGFCGLCKNNLKKWAGR